MYIVSPRLREFIEKEAPGSAEFWPVRIAGTFEGAPEFDYWAINWLRAFDCLHPQSYDGFHKDGSPSVIIPIIDVTRIPEDEVLGVLKDFRVECIIRADLKRKMQRLGFVGPQYSRLMHADGRNFKPFIKPDSMHMPPSTPGA